MHSLILPVADSSEVRKGPDLQVNVVPEEPGSPTEVSSETPSSGCWDRAVSCASTWQVLGSSGSLSIFVY